MTDYLLDTRITVYTGIIYDNNTTMGWEDTAVR